jgi:squalene-associated FAD-dependent desaturase
MAEALDRTPVRGLSIRHVHVVGAGLAGLAAALSLVAQGVAVTVHESGPAAGGRCRSYFDRELGCRIDNGNHLLLSGNRAAFAYLEQIGAGDDMGTGERWTLRPNRSRLPLWIFSPRRRVKGARLAEYLALARLRWAGPDATVAATLRDGPLYRRLLEPLAVAALNTPPDVASARLLAAVVQESLAQGGAACIPFYPAQGLSETFVNPALAWLESHGATIRFGARIAELTMQDGNVAQLGPHPVGPGEALVLAVPPAVASTLLPGLTVPDQFESILNVHFRAEAEPGEAGFIGLVGGTAEWIFVKPGVVSVTISAGNRAVDTPADVLADQVWADVRIALRLPEPMPPWRVVKEKRATIAATPEQERRRPATRTSLANLFLAGDWTATGLPGTIEGAIRSGRSAAAAILQA